MTTSGAEKDARAEALAFDNWMHQVRRLRREARLPASSGEAEHEWTSQWQLVAFDNYFNEGKTPDMFVADTCEYEGGSVPTNLKLPAKTPEEALGRMLSWSYDHGGSMYRVPHVTAMPGRSLYDMLEVKGAEGSTIPPHLAGRWHVRDVGVDVVLVRSKTDGRGFAKRLFVVCPRCKRRIEAGHFHQHVWAKNKCKEANNGKATK